MKSVQLLHKQPSNKRCEFLELRIGKTRRGFWGKDRDNTFWLLSTKSYNDCFKMRYNVKYVFYEWAAADTVTEASKRVAFLKET